MAIGVGVDFAAGVAGGEDGLAGGSGEDCFWGFEISKGEVTAEEEVRLISDLRELLIFEMSDLFWVEGLFGLDDEVEALFGS